MKMNELYRLPTDFRQDPVRASEEDTPVNGGNLEKEQSHSRMSD